MKLGFIGAGNMAGAIFKGLIKSEAVAPQDIMIIRNNKQLQAQQVSELGIKGCESYTELISNSDVVFLGVKPVAFPALLKEIKGDLKKYNPVIVSMAAGLSTDDIEEQLGFKPAIIRIMPNINAEVLMSATAICGNTTASDTQIANIKDLLSNIGLAVLVNQNQFAIFTAIAGCSPAYVYMFIEGLAKGALKLGMNKKQALEIAAQAVLGSAKMFLDSDNHPCELTDKVCSPSGTTIAGVCTLDEYKFIPALVKAVENSVIRDAQLKG